MPYILNTPQQARDMLEALGLSSREELFSHLPAELRLTEPLRLGLGMSEQEVRAELKDLAEKNTPLPEYTSFLGAGCYCHYIPAALDTVLSRSEFYTAYTPYQPECSQGTLQAIYEFQSYICLLTGMDVANASLYDGATALAEAVLMALRITKREKVLVLSSVHPEYRKVLKTYLAGLEYSLDELPFSPQGFTDRDVLAGFLDDTVSCLVVQNPDFFGLVEDLADLAETAHGKGALLVSVSNPFSLALLEEPKKLGVDIVCGDAQVFGAPPSFGGPGCGFMAAREKYTRQLPGRIVGRTTDNKGRPGFCLTLQTREQHIRREKATSNICSNQSLNALAAAVYLGLLGKEGLRRNVLTALNMARYLFRRLQEVRGVTFPFSHRFFHEFVWAIDGAASKADKLRRQKYIPGLILEKFYPEMKNKVLSCCTEMTTVKDIDRFIEALKKITEKG